MDFIILIMLVFILLSLLVRSDFMSCPNWDNIVRALPNMDILKIICSYAGQVLVDKQQNTKYFYWFFIKTYYTHLESVPIIFHLGDGMHSSLINAFGVLGPINITDGEYFESVTSYRNISNIVYVDFPGLGFGITDDHEAKTLDQLNVEFVSFFNTFFTLYPVLKKNKFYILGIQHTAKIAISLGDYIQRNSTFTNFGGVIAHNPLFNLAYQGQALTKKAYYLGIYNNYINRIVSNKLAFTTSELDDQSYYCNTEFQKALLMLSNIMLKLYNTDIRADYTNSYIIESLNDYFNLRGDNKGDISLYLHVDDYYKINLKITENSLLRLVEVYTHDPQAIISDYLTFNKPLIVNVGSNVGYIDGGNLESYLTSIYANQDFRKTQKQLFRIDNDNLLYSMISSHLYYLVYPLEGYEIGQYSSSAYLNALNYIFTDKPIPTEKIDTSKIQSFLSNCNKGLYENGTCVCDKIHTGVACEIEINNTFEGKIQFMPSEKKYYNITLFNESVIRLEGDECSNVVIYVALNASCWDCEMYSFISHTNSLFYNINKSNALVILENKNHSYPKVCTISQQKYLDSRTIMYQNILKVQMILIILITMIIGWCWVKSKSQHSLII